MAGITEAIWQLRDALAGKAARPSTSKAAATVSRVEPDGTVWVRLAGGDGETPITKPTTAEVSAGDSVTVEIGRGSSRLVGNSSTPAVGAAQVTTIVNPVAEIAAQAVTDAATAATAATEATESAAVAKAAADSANDNLKSVVSGAQTVEKAVSVMQTALEAVVDYDPQTDTTTEWFWHDADGAHVLGETSGYRNDIDSNGMHIVDVSDESEVAQFAADGAQVGKSAGAHVSIAADGIDLYAGSTSATNLAHFGYASGATASGGTSVQPYYTLGTRAAGSGIGNYSASVGTNNTASAYSAYAEGYSSTASGFASHAEGSARATARLAHAEGDYTLASGEESHAEGNNSTASSYSSHAEGIGTTASGYYSHAQNRYTTAQRKSQTAIGEYNVLDTTGSVSTRGDYALIIGNGTSSSARSNALTVDWNGNVACGTVNGVDVTKMVSTTGTIAINNSPVSGSNSSLYWARFGNVVSGYFSCKLNGAISAWSYARLGSSGSLPAPASGISMYWPIMLDGNGSTQAAFNLGSTGIPYIHMRGGTGAVGNVFHGSFCYVCANGA